MELPTVSPRGARYEQIGSTNAGEAREVAPKTGYKKWLIGASVCAAALIGGTAFYGHAGATVGGVPILGAALPVEGTKESAFDADGRFIVSKFDTRKPFASFLPGLGGEWGLPIWAFYVNRGQGMAAFGTENKDNPIAMFNTANVAYQTTTTSGFRTIVKVKRHGEKDRVVQPFFELGNPNRTMMIGMNELEIIESDYETGLEMRVLYYTVPGEDFAALVRRVTFTNLEQTPLELDVIDGLARMEPFGVNQGQLTAMGRTLEGWMNVYNCENVGACTTPFYKLSASTADSAQVQMIVEGNFAVSFVEGETDLLPIIVDPEAVFGVDTTLRTPMAFKSIKELVKRNELKSSKTPCALAAAVLKLAPGTSRTMVTMLGRANSLQQLEENIVPAVLEPKFVPMKYIEAVEMTDRLTSTVQSSTANPLFDAFSRQMMLDNLLRGGYPEFLGDEEDPKVYHTFSRIHGDLERDYNNFQIDASYFSQGSGNYRDVNQNRRVDVWLFPAVGDFNLRQFLTMKQADGYNPLTVQTATFVLNDDEDKAKEEATLLAATLTEEGGVEALAGLLARPFRPGQLFLDAEKHQLNLTVDREEFLDAVAAASDQTFAANYTHEGFWADHWTYDLDQVESFQAIFPDKLEHAMFDAEKLPFYMSSGRVQPRDFKYVEVTPGVVRQYNSVYEDEKKAGQLSTRLTFPDGSFELALGPNASELKADTYVYKVRPVAKLILLCVAKFALLDPSGFGIEMDANKPGWNDAMNGLPGLIGSGMPETAETLRLARWLLSLFKEFPTRAVTIPEELGEHIKEIAEAQTKTGFAYWNTVATSREKYRDAVNLFFSGDEVTLSHKELKAFFEAVELKLDAGIQRAIEEYSKDGVTMPTYFAHEVTDYKYTGYQNFVGQKFVTAKSFKPKGFPLFLEGPVRQLKTVARDDTASLVAIHDAVLASPLYDKPIEQYKICESLKGQPFEMGRMMAFTPGWLENESIWLHMSFKYYLELLRAKLHTQFWTAMETGAPYNMDLDLYGRSPLECASFIVSSAYPDEASWGTGFLARLSGSTAEFLSMWLLIFIGDAPFVTVNKSLVLALRPAIPASLFKDDGTATFSFLGKIQVTYHNPSGVDTWTALPIKYALKNKNGKVEETIHADSVSMPHSKDVREFKYDAIDVYFE